ncbi:MAG: flagellar biosynthesis anti-sigma factor FlgM [Bacillota bacterium]|nr:flagellar biosynthesis anti-sigma factor FlgM [Bacillota bacterium]HHU62524.1 flagellar biosynthesis anti-sigma factor FlgM [Natronincola sp.]
MNISNKAAIQRVAQIYQGQRQTSKVKKKSGSVNYNDEVTLSTEGKEMQTMLEKLKATPDIRPQAMEIKTAIENGTYKISARQIAQGLASSLDRS